MIRYCQKISRSVTYLNLCSLGAPKVIDLHVGGLCTVLQVLAFSSYGKSLHLNVYSIAYDSIWCSAFVLIVISYMYHLVQIILIVSRWLKLNQDHRSTITT